MTTQLWQGPHRVATAGLAWDARGAAELRHCLADLQVECMGPGESGPMPAWQPWLAVRVAPEYVQQAGADHEAAVSSDTPTALRASVLDYAMGRRRE